jgi:hypothetical protein
MMSDNRAKHSLGIEESSWIETLYQCEGEEWHRVVALKGEDDGTYDVEK